MQPQRLDGLSFGAGVLFVALGVAFLFEDAIDLLTAPWLWPAVLVVVGLALLVAAARRGNGAEPAGEGTATLPPEEPGPPAGEPAAAAPDAPFPPAAEGEGPSPEEPTAELPPAPGAQPSPAAEESAGGDEAEPSGHQSGADPGAAPGNRDPRA